MGRVLTPGKGAKSMVRLQGYWEHGDQRASASYYGCYVVCSQGCSLIFILQTILLISPEGCPFPLHTLNPIRNHKRAKKVRSGHLNIFTSPGTLAASAYFLICRVKCGQRCSKHSGSPCSSVKIQSSKDINYSAA